MIPHNVVGDKLLNLLLSKAVTSKGRTQEGSPTRKSSKKLLPTTRQQSYRPQATQVGYHDNNTTVYR